MYQGVTYVDPSHDPVLYEGSRPATVVVTNAGPGQVTVKAWDETEPQPTAKPQARLRLSPGNHRIVSGRLVRVSALPDQSTGPSFAAVGWSVQA
jgi:hypothetical protein